MRWIDGLSKSQRIIVVIALGLALVTVGDYLVSLGEPGFGWTGYAPLTSGFYAPARLHGWLRVIIWLALIGLWAVASIRLLRPASENAAGHPDND
jgi:heme/copper-type cytochrome/quinol oxidase subunit 1